MRSLASKLRITAGLFWLLLHAAPILFAQSPLTLDQVLQGLAVGGANQVTLIQQIRDRGVNFHLDIVALEQLVDAGAKPDLIEAIEAPRNVQPNATPENPSDPNVIVFRDEATTADLGPVTRERILVDLKTGADQALLAGLITQHGISFPYTPELGRELQSSGASPTLLAVIATATVGHALVPEGFQDLPVARATDFDASTLTGRFDLRLFVDGAAEVRLQGDRAIFKTLQSQPARDAGSERTQPFPARALKKLDVKKRDGRGAFVVLQKPSAENGHEMMIRVYDPKGGEDRYHLRIEWEVAP